MGAMSSTSSDVPYDSPVIDPEELGLRLGQGLDDLDPTQKSVAERFGVSEDALTNWRRGKGLKAQQFSVFFWAARRSSRLRRWVASLIGLDVDSALEDEDIARIVRALDLARRRRDWPQIRETMTNQLRWLGVYKAAEEEGGGGREATAATG